MAAFLSALNRPKSVYKKKTLLMSRQVGRLLGSFCFIGGG